MLKPHHSIALYMEGHFGHSVGKLGYGVLRYSSNPVACVVDSTQVGAKVGEHLQIDRSCPIVSTLREATALGANVLVLGIANSGGVIPDEWRPALDEAVTSGMSIVNGLHEPLALHYSGLRTDQWIWDVRQEPKELSIARGRAQTLSAQRVLTVGTDMAQGKMTTTLELLRGTRARGRTPRFVATGQIGMVISGSGIPLDAIRVDYAAGAVEQEVMRASDADVIFIEGQGALAHPGSSCTLPLLRGACPTDLILCHRAGQTHLNNLPDIAIPELRAYITMYEELSSAGGVFPRARVRAVSLNTSHLDAEHAQKAIDQLQQEIDLPVADPIRNGPDLLLDALLI